MRDPEVEERPQCPVVTGVGGQSHGPIINFYGLKGLLVECPFGLWGPTRHPSSSPPSRRSTREKRRQLGGPKVLFPIGTTGGDRAELVEGPFTTEERCGPQCPEYPSLGSNRRTLGSDGRCGRSGSGGSGAPWTEVVVDSRVSTPPGPPTIHSVALGPPQSRRRRPSLDLVLQESPGASRRPKVLRDQSAVVGVGHLPFPTQPGPTRTKLRVEVTNDTPEPVQ